MNIKRKAAAEFLGTAFLLVVIVGSGIMGEKLSNGNNAVALLANSVATGAGLIFLILSFGNISGAHFNPALTLTEVFRSNLSWRESFIHIVSQIAGAFFGVGAANLMFDLPVYFASNKIRAGNSQFLSEFVATFGLIAVIRAGVKFHPNLIFLMVASYITAAYWFTASTSFANPAVTLARSTTNTFAGINAANVPMFIVAQLLGAFSATLVFNWLLNEKKMLEKKKVLILCTGNSARSQIAEELLKHITSNEYVIYSAGTKPSIVRPEAIKVLREVGIDISKNRSKSVEEFTDKKMDFVLTVCDSAKEICPFFPAQTKMIHHSFKDPAEIHGDEKTRVDAFRETRDEIQEYLKNSFCEIIDR